MDTTVKQIMRWIGWLGAGFAVGVWYQKQDAQPQIAWLEKQLDYFYKKVYERNTEFSQRYGAGVHRY